MLLFNNDPRRSIFPHVPPIHFLSSQEQNRRRFTKIACIDRVSLHILLILGHLDNRHFLSVPDRHFTIDSDRKHLVLCIVEIQARYFAQMGVKEAFKA